MSEWCLTSAPSPGRVQLQSPPTQGEGVGPLAARDEETGVGAVVTGVGAPPPEDGDSEDGQSKYQGEGRPKGTAANRVRRRKGARKITAKDVPFPSFHTSEDVWWAVDGKCSLSLESPLFPPPFPLFVPLCHDYSTCYLSCSALPFCVFFFHVCVSSLCFVLLLFCMAIMVLLVSSM